jgi:hypothetical protein
VTAFAALAAVAAAATVTPATGAWQGKAKDVNDRVSFTIAKTSRGYEAKSIKVRTDASCEDLTPGGAVSVRALKLSLPVARLTRVSKKGGSLKTWTFASSRSRALDGGKRSQSVTLKVTLSGDKAAKASASVKDDVTVAPKLRCRSKVGVTVRSKD